MSFLLKSVVPFLGGDEFLRSPKNRREFLLEIQGAGLLKMEDSKENAMFTNYNFTLDKATLVNLNPSSSIIHRIHGTMVYFVYVLAYLPSTSTIHGSASF